MSETEVSPSAFQHPAIIDPTNSVFVIGAAIFTTLLTEGKRLTLLLRQPNRDLLVFDIQEARVQAALSEHREPLEEGR